VIKSNNPKKKDRIGHEAPKKEKNITVKSRNNEHTKMALIDNVVIVDLWPQSIVYHPLTNTQVASSFLRCLSVPLTVGKTR